jgi:hypothetical protein
MKKIIFIMHVIFLFLTLRFKTVRKKIRLYREDKKIAEIVEMMKIMEKKLKFPGYYDGFERIRRFYEITHYEKVAFLELLEGEKIYREENKKLIEQIGEFFIGRNDQIWCLSTLGEFGKKPDSNNIFIKVAPHLSEKSLAVHKANISEPFGKVNEILLVDYTSNESGVAEKVCISFINKKIKFLREILGIKEQN